MNQKNVDITIQNYIKSKQNEEFMLKCQYTARYYFNKNEKLNLFITLGCIASSLTILINTQNYFISIGLPLAIDLICLWLQSCSAKAITNAANLRKYFDANVLDINANEYSEDNLRELRELVFEVIEKNSKKAKIEIKNTGHDNPPGVYDWYEFHQDYPGIEAKFECQRQNAWWNKEMISGRIKMYFISIILIIILMFVLIKILNIPIISFRFLLCSALIIRIIERCHALHSYMKSSSSIDVAIEMTQNSKTEPNIAYLQRKIDERRAINVVEVNLIHKWKANYLSNKYKKITQKNL